MKRKAKRINRGVVLTVIILVGFIVYIIVDTNMFKKNKPEIMDTVKSFVTDMAAAGVTPEALQTLDGTELDTAALEAWSSDCQSVMNEYWTTTTNSKTQYSSMYYGESKDMVFSCIKSAIDFMAKAETLMGYVTDQQVMINEKETDIRKCGTNAAKVTLTCTTTVEYVGTPEMINACGTSCIGGYYYSYEEGMQTDTTKYGVVMEQYMDIILMKDGGSWKVAYISNNGWSNDEPYVIEAEETEGEN